MKEVNEMKMVIRSQSPDGVNVCIYNLLVGTVEEANILTSFIMDIDGKNKISVEECKKVFQKIKMVK